MKEEPAPRQPRYCAACGEPTDASEMRRGLCRPCWQEQQDAKRNSKETNDE